MASAEGRCYEYLLITHFKIQDQDDCDSQANAEEYSHLPALGLSVTAPRKGLAPWHKATLVRVT